ncbi:MAG: alpha/beta hydrolase-fold protein [Alphaproteobacteria bacterium]|nr:alpha/beta hydrolase-fold protein [Alphaproteobacteria bacterium]
MKLRAIAALVFLAACATPPASQAQQTPAAAPASGTPITIGTSYVLHSAVLGDERQVNVWTPADYGSAENANRRYNVLYVLDGALDQDFEHIAGLGQLGALSWTYEPLIVVGIQTKDRRAELTRRPQDPRHAAEFPQAGGARKFQDFIATEVIPFIDANYRTGEGRALMGESLAGLFVVDTFLHRPELFRDYIAISPSLWWDDQHFARDGDHDLEGRAASNRRLYLAIANEGGAQQAGTNRFLALLEAAPRGCVTWRYSDRSATETHATIYHAAALDALRWLYAMPEPNYGPTPWYYEENGTPPPAH